MAFTKIPIHWILRWVEWIVLLANLLSGLLSTYFQESPELLFPFIVYTIAFFILSFIFPVDRPPSQRRIYIAAEVILVVSAAWIRLWFSLLMYFILAKSCFLLKRRDVVIVGILTGIGYLSGNAWTLPQRVAETVTQLQTQTPEEVYNPRAILLVSSVEYLGASLFVILFGFVMIAERQSRQRAETLAKEVETLAATLERTRIARDIHDSLGHLLTTLDVQIEVAQKYSRREPAKAMQALDTAKNLAGQCLKSVRNSLQIIHQSNFDLNQALYELIHQIQMNQSFQFHLDINLPQLPPQISHQIYNVIREGLTNIQKHANATQIHLQGWATSNEIRLKLIDDGQGFYPHSPHAGFGLRGMQERVQILGGQVTINSAIGQGTQILVTIPLPLNRHQE
jgi:signal transduction histidine kinase